MSHCIRARARYSGQMEFFVALAPLLAVLVIAALAVYGTARLARP